MAIIIEHGIAVQGKKPLAYYGWPTVARSGGKLFIAASGPRYRHVCPYGKTSVFVSEDEGRTYAGPYILADSTVDDRDAGILALEDETLLVSSFSSDTRIYDKHFARDDAPDVLAFKRMGYADWREADVARDAGMWMMKGKLGGVFQRRRVPLSTPHGPIRLRDGRFLYLGKAIFEYAPEGPQVFNQKGGALKAAASADGLEWSMLGEVPMPEGADLENFHEPHVCELADGTLLGALRYQHNYDGTGLATYPNFTTWLTRSSDGGRTWSVPEQTEVMGAPAHLLVHSGGAVVLTYGYRQKPFGERAAISHDGGKTFTEHVVLRDDGPTLDLGYPATVELQNGDLYTVYYQQLADGEPTSLLYTRWRL